MSLMTNVEFVLEDEFQELGVGELVGGSFLQSGRQTLAKAGETELFEGGVQGSGIHEGVKQSGVSWA